ncbi:MAG: hypothetical protein JSV10_07345 [Candidatus Zixiibacteriota bacterium]|nr:MAG: hypothetical protein JSV10_07345 [candidate division Zixibacteria bacterium]
MDQAPEGTREFAFCHSYPKPVIVIRWVILGGAFALGIYIMTSIKEVLGLAYVIYSLVVLTLILPLSRCTSCFYHGKACNTGWGKVAAYLFPKGDESKFVDHYDYSIFIHLLWIIPLLASLFQLARERSLLALAVVLAYAFVLSLEKIALKKLACSRCRQREFCPAVPFRKTAKV